ncbi:MAG: hypothetical protein EKK53_17690 [Burkholderiales bacterium]|nr:MAG: hypothetical protein EKK53_17690 [Burkholderiales bacterium]
MNLRLPRLPALPLLAACAVLAACSSLEGGRPYHAFELGVAPEAGTVQHLRWRYGELEGGEKPIAVGSHVPFVLRRQTMPVPDAFEASWQAADGSWRRVCLPVRRHVQRGVEGHSLLFWLTADGAHGEFVTYTPRGDQRERFAAAAARVVDAAAAQPLAGTCAAAGR